jgi:hypothetical protein
MMAGRRGTATILIVIAAVLGEPEELLRPCAAVATRQHLACRDVQRREEAERAVAHVVLRRSFRLSDVNRQDRLRPLERLDLRFLVAPCSETC